MTTLMLAAKNETGSLDRLSADRAAIRIVDETAADVPARERLLDAAFGAGRFEKTSERLREGRAPARGLSLAAHLNGALVGTIRLWHIATDSGHAALLLGPVAVSAAHQSLGIGGALIREALRRASARGHGAVILVGDAPYYERFGFEQRFTQALDMPGPVDRARFLALEFKSGALAGATGMLRPTGAAAMAKGSIRMARLKRAA